MVYSMASQSLRWVASSVDSLQPLTFISGLAGPIFSRKGSPERADRAHSESVRFVRIGEELSPLGPVLYFNIST